MAKQVHIHIHRTRSHDAFEESKHPRAANGQFGSGGGAKKAKAPAGPAPSKGQAEGGTREQDRNHFLNVVRDPKNATAEQLREAVNYWHEAGTAAGHGGQEHAASQQRMRMAVSELQARGENVPGFEKPAPAQAKPTALPGVNAFSPPKSTSAQISASMVTYRSNTTGAGTAPRDKSQYGNWLFDSAPGSLADHSRTGGTFAISGTYAEAEQKAKQQAAAWGHSQLRLAP